MPNPGFIAQLKVWECCRFDLYQRDEDGEVVGEKDQYVDTKARLQELGGFKLEEKSGGCRRRSKG